MLADLGDDETASANNSQQVSSDLPEHDDLLLLALDSLADDYYIVSESNLTDQAFSEESDDSATDPDLLSYLAWGDFSV